MKKLVSIVVPVYNVKDYLKKCLDSIIGQTYRRIEIILVDDGSNDGSEKIVDDYSKTDNRIVVIHKENGGLSSARNVGIDMAKGDYITFVDSDDFVDSNMIEKMLKEAVDRSADLVICNRIYYYENGKTIVKKKYDKTAEMTPCESLRELMLGKKYDMAAWAKMYKKELFNDIRFPVGKISEDYFVMYKLFDLSNKVVLIPDHLYYYAQRKGSISKTPKLRYDYIDAAKEQRDYILKKYPNMTDLAHAAYGLSHMTVYDIYIRNGGRCNSEMIREFRGAVKEELSHIHKSHVSHTRMIQALLFIYCLPLYNQIIKRLG